MKPITEEDILDSGFYGLTALKYAELVGIESKLSILECNRSRHDRITINGFLLEQELFYFVDGDTLTVAYWHGGPDVIGCIKGVPFDGHVSVGAWVAGDHIDMGMYFSIEQTLFTRFDPQIMLVTMTKDNEDAKGNDAS